MYTTQTSRITVTPNQLYRKVVKKISSTQQTYKEKLKRTISHKYEKHISLLESHRKREIRFQNNASILDQTIEEKNKQLRIAFLEKDKKINESRAKFMSEKKKKLQNSFNQWQNVQFENKRKHQNELQQSQNLIKKWNDKCEESLSKKKFRLNTISSNLSERSRISSAKSTRHQQKELQKMLQKVLVNNPQTPESKQNSSRSKIHFINQNSRISSASKISNKSYQVFKKTEQQNLQKYLAKYVKKQTHIKQVRNKKAQLFNQVKKLKQQKSFQIDLMHKNNNYYLNTKRKQMQEKLDQKFLQDRRKNIDANRSLPSIHTKANIGLIYGQRKSDHQNKTEKKINKRTSTIEPRFDKVIMDELRNITLMSKIKNLKK